GDIDGLAARAAKFLAPDFRDQYTKFVAEIVSPNRQAQITNSSEVLGVAVESLSGSDASALIFVNTTSTSPLTGDKPELKYLSYRLIMQESDSRWLITKMTTVTSLDLTPTTTAPG